MSLVVTGALFASSTPLIVISSVPILFLSSGVEILEDNIFTFDSPLSSLSL